MIRAAALILAFGVAVGLFGMSDAQDTIQAMVARIKVKGDALDPEISIWTPHKLKGSAEAWLQGYVDRKTGALTVQLLVTNNAMRAEAGPTAVSYRGIDGPVQRTVTPTPAPLGKCPVDSTCRWAPLETARSPLPCRTLNCAIADIHSVGWLVTTLSLADADAAARGAEPWRYKVKNNQGGEATGELPQEFFAALLSVAERNGARAPPQ